jgi:hypothetical protein
VRRHINEEKSIEPRTQLVTEIAMVIKDGAVLSSMAFPTTTLADALPLFQTVPSRDSFVGAPNFFLSAAATSDLSVPATV